MARAIHQQRAPAVRRRECPRCGQPVDTFKDADTGLTTRLDTTSPPITASLMHPMLRNRLWEYRGARLGWLPKWAPAGRNWRELRTLHTCPTTTNKDRS